VAITLSLCNFFATTWTSVKTDYTVHMFEQIGFPSGKC